MVHVVVSFDCHVAQPYIGYENAAKVVKKATAEGKDLRSVVRELDLMGDEDLDKALDVLAMTRGDVVGG